MSFLKKQYLMVIPLIILALAAGIWGGLMRMGWNLPVSEFVRDHRAIMTGSFLGTVITLERTVVLKRKWFYVFPFISGLSLAFFLMDNITLAYFCLATTALGLIAIYLMLYFRHREYYFLIMMLGAIGWLNGSIILIGGGLYSQAAPWWIAFILFTVLGERIELTKFLPGHMWKKPVLFAGIIVILIGLLISYHSMGQYLTGFGIVVIGFWLLRFDMARKSSATLGIHQHTGMLLLAGYFWLVLTCVLMLLGIRHPLIYDAILHTFFLGFTFSMIFAHGPIILPGIAGLPIKPFHPFLFVWGALLQLSVMLRLVGDLYLWAEIRLISGLMAGLVIVLFFVSLFSVARYKLTNIAAKNSF